MNTRSHEFYLAILGLLLNAGLLKLNEVLDLYEHLDLTTFGLQLIGGYLIAACYLLFFVFVLGSAFSIVQDLRSPSAAQDGIAIGAEKVAYAVLTLVIAYGIVFWLVFGSATKLSPPTS